MTEVIETRAKIESFRKDVVKLRSYGLDGTANKIERLADAIEADLVRSIKLAEKIDRDSA